MIEGAGGGNGGRIEGVRIGTVLFCVTIFVGETLSSITLVLVDREGLFGGLNTGLTCFSAYTKTPEDFLFRLSTIYTFGSTVNAIVLDDVTKGFLGLAFFFGYSGKLCTFCVNIS